MTLKDLAKAPFPYFGGKSHAAPAIWSALGDVVHFVDPFCGSLAALLLRPHEANRPYHSETVNDRSGLLVNALRSIKFSPDETADAASWYVSEADMTARQLSCIRWEQEENVERLMADEAFHDPIVGGAWIYGMCCWIGSGFASGDGPWVVGADGRLTKRSGGVSRQLPHISSDGRGVNHAGTREAGVAKQLPHISSDGQGVNHAGTREAGVAREETRRDAKEEGAESSFSSRPFAGDTAGGLIIPDDLDFHPFTMP